MRRRDWLIGAATLPLTAFPLTALARSLAATPPGAAAVALAADGQAVVSTGSARRLVLVELHGANDGLNTVVPWRDDAYRKLRPTLGLKRSQLLDVDDEIGLNDSLRSLMPMMQNGELAVLQGLGYPQPNRSHFASIALWETGGDGKAGAGRDGWLVHDIEHGAAHRELLDPHGLSLKGPIGPLLSDGGRWLTASSVAQLAALSVPGEAPRAAAGVLDTGVDSVLARVATRVHELDRALGALTDRLDSAPAVSPIGGGSLGQQLTEVARFVAAGLETPVYRVRHEGFDTHINQVGRHPVLLSQLADGLSGFRDVMLDLGEWQETLVVTYSEFGRRAGENRSGGTDHGTAAPHFVLGGRLDPALTVSPLRGSHPSLTELVDHDPVATMDYRAVYDRLLSDGFGVHDNRFSRWRDLRLGGLIVG